MEFLFPKTAKGQSIYLFIILVMVAVMFTQQYGWFDWTKWLKKPADNA